MRSDPSTKAERDVPVATEQEPAEQASGEGSLLELVLEAQEQRPVDETAGPERIEGVVIGRLVAVPSPTEPIVDYPGCGSTAGLPARAMTELDPSAVDRPVALMFERGEPDKPVVIGLIHDQVAIRPQVEADGERLEFAADQEIVLRCGKASITLTRAGKIIVRGAYVSTRASGVNRIQGGSVQIN